MHSESVDAGERRAAMVGVNLKTNIVDRRCDAWLNIEGLSIALLKVIGDLRNEIQCGWI